MCSFGSSSSKSFLGTLCPQFYCFKHDGVLSRRASYDNEVVRVAAYMPPAITIRFYFTPNREERQAAHSFYCNRFSRFFTIWRLEIAPAASRLIIWEISAEPAKAAQRRTRQTMRCTCITLLLALSVVPAALGADSEEEVRAAEKAGLRLWSHSTSERSRRFITRT